MWEKFNKTKKMIELSRETSDTITSSVENWKSYLNTASQFYKYSFDDQIMIYAQRPDCTACASIPIWNKKMLRWVKSGSKGIALIREQNQKPYLTYVFALEDTMTSNISKTPYLWKMKEQHYESVLAMLEQYEGNTEQKDIAKRLMEIAVSIVDTHDNSYFKNMLPYLEDTYLGELDEQQSQGIFREVCIKSVQYILLHRCGIDTSKYISDEDLQNIMMFTTPELLHHLGTAINEISNDILRNIERTVKTVEKSIAINKKKEYNQHKEQFNTLNRETKVKEGSFKYGRTELHKSGGLPDTGFGNGERGGRQRTEQIRFDEGRISQKDQQRQVQLHVADGQTLESSSGSGRASTTIRGQFDKTNDENRESNRKTESRKSNGMGTKNEQHSSESGRNRQTGNDIHLKQTEQIKNKIEQTNETKKLPQFIQSYPKEIVLGSLEHTAFLKKDWKEVSEYFSLHSNEKERATFIKTVYKNEKLQSDINGITIGFEYRQNGILYWSGNENNKISQSFLSWDFIQKAVALLLKYQTKNRDIPTIEQQAENIEKAEQQQSSAFFVAEKNVGQISLDLQQSQTDKISTEKNELLQQPDTEENNTNNDVSELQTSQADKLSTEENEQSKTLYVQQQQEKNEPLQQPDTKENNTNNDVSELQTSQADKLSTEENEQSQTLYIQQQKSEQLLQYNDLKQKYPNYLIGVNIKGFYQFYGKDADIVSEQFHRETVKNMGESFNLKIPLDLEEIKVLLQKQNIILTDKKEYIPLTNTIKLENRPFRLDGINFDTRNIVLRDLEMSGIFPLFRKEKISFVKGQIEKQLQEITAKQSIDVTEIQQKTEKLNFHIADDFRVSGGKKTKYQQNTEAIKLLKKLETENRLASAEEQQILSKYVGWGGLAEAFDSQNEKWSKEYSELKELFTPEEYKLAKASTLNAHYTSATIIKAMYQAIEHMDLNFKNILEPSCGIGHFFGLLPETMKNTNLYGVELDSITGRIAKQLYQKANITIDGFEKTNFKDNFFDIAIGNVPFGSYKVMDKKYDKYNFLIHDYFFAKTLDKVKTGGIVAFITSKGTLDKENDNVRSYLSERADLLGAIRLPNNVFFENAGTEVTTDILFLQKRETPPEKQPSWVQIGTLENGIAVNNYFVENPRMILGQMDYWSNMYGNEKETACIPIDGAVLEEQLKNVITNIALPNRTLFQTVEIEEIESLEEEVEKIPADNSVRNFSYTIVEGKEDIFFRENNFMYAVAMKENEKERVKGLLEIRDSTRKLINLQLNGMNEQEIVSEQQHLNHIYDVFHKKYGVINGKTNKKVFQKDSSYPLLCSLEIIDEEGKLERKADMFTKRTIQKYEPITHVDTAVDALAVSISEKACVDIGFMASLMGGSEKTTQVINELQQQGLIFKTPQSGTIEQNQYSGWQTADEYLSGNVRKKLEQAQKIAKQYPEFEINVTALEKVQPKDLEASEIGVRIGTSWIEPNYYKQFLFELLETPMYKTFDIDVMYSSITNTWNIKGKSVDSNNTHATVTYGTTRISAYTIFEKTLNQQDIKIYDVIKEDDTEKRVLNAKETTIAQQKQEAMEQAFQEWIWKDPQRRRTLCKKYNKTFNSIVPREYDGSHITFVGMNPEITLQPHQKNGVARVLYGKNALLAYCVGSGKTYTMAAAAMESKRLGLCQKSMFVVPNHLTEQWGREFLQLYTGANILVATKKDFEPLNRKKFCSRIATGEFDAVIIGHTQFEKIPLSKERQMQNIQQQLEEVEDGIAELKAERGERFQIKQLEKTKKNLEVKLEKLNDDSKKDNVITFEELGIDRLFVDEAHSYKNMFHFTKMRNVAGISQTEAQKSSDMYAKCRYLDEIIEGKGVTFATGTPLSNSMTELYTMMKYLQYDMLEQKRMTFFDCWAANFGQKVTALEIAPEGTGFRFKTRFARFFNLPELMNLWKEATDIQTADMLKLPVPEVEYITVQTEPSQIQKDMVKELGERADKVRNREVDPKADNMLSITNDGRKLALDQRLMNTLLPDDPNSKVNACVKNVFEIWQKSQETQGTQIVFCDQSTPHYDGKFNVYDDMKKKLIEKGIPEKEIAFIHDMKTEIQKEELFSKVRKGKIRVLFGSTSKLGVGTNIQKKLIASHDLDCPWRPADLSQRMGRIARKGNENQKVAIFRYVTKDTFDSYSWSLIENKQRFIGQVMTSKNPARSAEDIDSTALSYAEIKSLTTGDKRIKEKMDLDVQVKKLKLLKANHTSQLYYLQDKIAIQYPNMIKISEQKIERLEQATAILQQYPKLDDNFSMILQGQNFKEKKEAGKKILSFCKAITSIDKPILIGNYRGFDMKLAFQGKYFEITLEQADNYKIELGEDAFGNITRINNAIESIPHLLYEQKERLTQLHLEVEKTKKEMEKPFLQEQELKQKSERLAELNAELDMEQTVNSQIQNQENLKSKTEQKQEIKVTEEPKKTSILTALHNFKPKENTTEIKKQREAVL